MNESMNKWSQNTLNEWINSLNTFNSAQKIKIINGLNNFGASGKDIFDADKDDLADSLEIGGMLAGKLFVAIKDHRDNQFKQTINSNNNCNIDENKDNDSNQDEIFSLNLQGQKNAYCRIDRLKSSYTVKYLKEQYLEYYGHDLKNEKKRKGLTIFRMGEKLEIEHYTLAQYNIYNDAITLMVTFRVDGGMAQQGDNDRYRVRKLRHKKYKQIKLSHEPDCIMGYTDNDGIKRAKMPCGCSFASDTMYRFMVAAFDQDNNFRSVAMKCPISSKQCKGTFEQRQWDWSLVFIIADLTDQEKRKYSEIINRRIAGIKNCPHCQSNCQRNKDLKIFRVRCNQCNGSDWCWECEKQWKGGGLTVCGNSNCTAERLNQILKNAKMITPEWSKDTEVPSTRHCPECLTIIQYENKCCHMTCVGCPHEFCFKCLANWKNKPHYSCNTVAPKQVIK